MRQTIAFREFDARLKSGTLTPAEYRRYLEVDPIAPTVRVRFRPGTVVGVPPLYDVDREVYLAQRAEQERRALYPAIAGQKRVVAEGDSWFNLPPFIRPQAIADRLKSNKRVAVKNIAKWGHTLQEMLARKEYLEEIPKFRPDWFIVSAGGNDAQELLKRGLLLQTYDPKRPIKDCVSPAGVALFEEIAEAYRTLLNEIAIRHPELRTICYAYDFPRPTYKGGKYIGQYVQKMGYPKKDWDAVGHEIINRLTKSIADVVAAFPNAAFLDCRGATAAHPFYDDMHPNTEGFKVLASLFEAKLQGTGAARARARTIRRRPAVRRVASRRSTTRKRVSPPGRERTKHRSAQRVRRSSSGRTRRPRARKH